jgi:hypothetical protein
MPRTCRLGEVEGDGRFGRSHWVDSGPSASGLTCTETGYSVCGLVWQRSTIRGQYCRLVSPIGPQEFVEMLCKGAYARCAWRQRQLSRTNDLALQRTFIDMLHAR